jgi:hypothetical protein
MNLIKFLEATIPVFHKWTPGEKRMRKRAIRRAHRGTNWSVLNRGKGRSGYVRHKSGKVYTFSRLSEQQRYQKAVTGRALGHSTYLRKK